MTTFKKQIQINTAKQNVWAVISNLSDIYKFNPNVAKSYYVGGQTERVGASRICELYPAGKIKETAQVWEEGKGFLLQIDPIEKAPPVKNFSGDFQLASLGINQTRVTVTIHYDMKLGVIGGLLNKLVLRSKMEESIENLLQGMKIHSN